MVLSINNLTGFGSGGVQPPFIEATSSAFQPSADVHSMSLPSGVVSGRLLIVCISIASSGPINNSTIGGVGDLFTTLVNTVHNGTVRQRINYRVLDGTESGAISGDITGSSVGCISFAMIISGFTGTPEVTTSGALGAVSSLTTPAITPSWAGNGSNLILPFCHWYTFSSVPTLSTYPYGTPRNTSTVDGNYGAAFCSNQVQSMTGAQTPGAFVLSGACVNGGGHTVAVRGF